MLTPEHFVAVRRTLGGPAPDVVRAGLAAVVGRAPAADEAALAAKRAPRWRAPMRRAGPRSRRSVTCR